jgi:RHS repeat-associated protein
MDDLTYVYKQDKPNQLQRVDDAVTIDTRANDIKDQTTTDNYQYNSIGQLIENTDEGVRYEYNASGLVTKVYHNDVIRVQFYYNDKNYRTKKESYDTDGNLEKTTDYILDASGTAMAIYENQELKEVPIYGASRLGVYKTTTNTSVYQLTDHLGNVRAVIAKNGNQAAAITSTTDYYPGGMVMPNRQIVNGEPYRYAYQGQEKDPETGKEAFQLRLWDARIGRWLTTDPYGQHASPYMGMSNNPALHYDPDGGCDQPDSSCGWFKRIFYSSIQIDAWDAWQANGITGSQTVLNEVTVSGVSRNTRLSRIRMFTEDGGIIDGHGNIIRSANFAFEISGVEFVTTDSRRDAIASQIGFATGFTMPSAKLPVVSRVANNTVKVKNTSPQVGLTIKHILSEGKVLFPNGKLQSGVYDFVITKANKVILGNGHYHLSNAANKLKAAGRITVNNQGVIKAIDNWSGHYQPNWYQLKNAKILLEKLGNDAGGARLTEIPF